MKRNISFTLEEATKLYKDLPPTARPLLESTFPELKLGICQKVTTLVEAFNELGLSYNEVSDTCYYIPNREDQAEYFIKIFAEALREGKDLKDCEYYPYFYGSGSDFSYFDFAYDNSRTRVGARLRVDTPEKAKHLGKCMLEYYRIYLGRE